MYIIGVDGGGTKTAIAAYNADGLVAHSKSGPMNYNFIGVENAAKNLMDGIRALGIAQKEIAAIGIGDPSLDDGIREGGDALSEKFKSAVEKELGIPVFMRSDAYITLFGLTEGKEPAVLMLSGTGAMGIAENKQGETLVAGGWGRLTGDEGGGYHIAIEAIKKALHAADGIAPPTALTDAALSHFGAASPRELIPIFYGEKDPNIASFSKVVSECAEAGDKTAKEVLLDAANYLISYTSRLIEWSGSRKVGVYGSVICNDTFIRQTYEQALRRNYPDITITEPPVSAQHAAALYAKKMIENY